MGSMNTARRRLARRVCACAFLVVSLGSLSACVFTTAPAAFLCTAPSDCTGDYTHSPAHEQCTCVLRTDVDADAGTTHSDAGRVDAGRDAGPPDAGLVDAGQPDAGQPDAGAPPAEHIVQVEAGADHTCILTSTGRVGCAGKNAGGQCGAPPQLAQPTLHWVELGGADVVELAAGQNHTCARTRSGNVWCWGSNVGYQLGHDALGDGEFRVVGPQVVPGLTGALSLHAGGETTCVRSRAGPDAPVRARCWGSGSSFQLGADERSRHTPLTLGYTDVTALAIGDTFLCVAGTEEMSAQTGVWCQGDNTKAQLGTGTASPRNMADGLPHRIGPYLGSLQEPVELEDVALSAGESHACAVHRAGSSNAAIVCWGDNQSGQVSLDNTAFHLPPTFVPGKEGRDQVWNAVQIDAGSGFMCASTTTDRVLCSGYNAAYRTGDSTLDGLQKASTIRMPGTNSYLSLRAGTVTTGIWHACALNLEDRVVCWGRTWDGRIGTGNDAEEQRLPQVAPAFDVFAP